MSKVYFNLVCISFSPSLPRVKLSRLKDEAGGVSHSAVIRLSSRSPLCNFLKSFTALDAGKVVRFEGVDMVAQISPTGL